MTRANAELHHPAPHRARVPVLLAAFGLAGGPLAWFVQLNAAFSLASAPCWAGGERTSCTGGGQITAIVLLYLLCLAVSLGAALASRIALQRVRGEVEGDGRHLLEVGGGRTRFLAICGLYLGAGFAFVILSNVFAILLVPRCAG